MAEAMNYAHEYSRALAQAYPYVLNFGALYNTENDTRYHWVNAKTIEIPVISTTGRVDADRDTIGTFTRNYSNKWETKTLSHHRKWSTLVHPMDIDETNMVTTITNITQTFNEENKFPEMDAYLISTLYDLWTKKSKEADETALSNANILSTFDKMMEAMDEGRVPAQGRILYVTPAVNTLLKSAVTRHINNKDSNIERIIGTLDTVQIVVVPSTLMKTKYTFTTGWEADAEADQINMFLVHPSAVITPEKYIFSRLDEPSAGSEGKYIYYEESYDGVFILEQRVDALAFNITKHGA